MDRIFRQFVMASWSTDALGYAFSSDPSLCWKPTTRVDSEVAMIRVDVELLYAARRLITGANVHRANTLIFQYEQSVAITNAGFRSSIDPIKFEQRLRDWVSEELKRVQLQLPS